MVVTKKFMRGIALFLAALSLFALVGCGGGGANDQKTLKVYNWEDYIDPSVLEDFEKETGIQIDYVRFTLNEDMYVKIKNKSGRYDVAFPSDYMIERMRKENLLLPIDHGKLTNFGQTFEWMQNPEYDPGSQYSVPYMWGTVGILYNTDMTGGPIDSWNAMWDEKYKQSVLMIKSPRDSLGITLKKLGYSMNSTDQSQLEQARDELIAQGKSGVRLAFGVDEIKDKMLNGEAALGLVWSGDAYNTMDKGDFLDYCVPKEGSNLWFDGMVIPQTCKNVDGAHQFIDFMMRPEIAKRNSEYIGYSTPNQGALALLPEEMQQDPTFNPPQDVIDRCEVMRDLGDALSMWNRVWTDVTSGS